MVTTVAAITIKEVMEAVDSTTVIMEEASAMEAEVGKIPGV